MSHKWEPSLHTYQNPCDIWNRDLRGQFAFGPSSMFIQRVAPTKDMKLRLSISLYVLAPLNRSHARVCVCGLIWSREPCGTSPQADLHSGTGRNRRRPSHGRGPCVDVGVQPRMPDHVLQAPRVRRSSSCWMPSVERAPKPNATTTWPGKVPFPLKPCEHICGTLSSEMSKPCKQPASHPWDVSTW